MKYGIIIILPIEVVICREKEEQGKNKRDANNNKAKAAMT
jgi:hypothetical protein